MNLLVDTNVYVDFIAKREPHAEFIKRLCIAKEFGDFQLWVNLQSFSDAFYLLKKDYGGDALKKVFLNSLEYFTPYSSSPSLLKPALESDWSEIEDYLIAYSYKGVDASYIITRDTEMIKKSPIPAMDAAAFLEHIQTDLGYEYEGVDWK